MSHFFFFLPPFFLFSGRAKKGGRTGKKESRYRSRAKKWIADLKKSMSEDDEGGDCPTIQGTAYDHAQYDPGYTHRMGCFDSSGRLCCQLICRNNYRCQNPAEFVLSVEQVLQRRQYCVKGKYQPPNFRNAPDDVHVCKYHWNRMKSGRQATFEWLSFAGETACKLAASVAAVAAVGAIAAAAPALVGVTAAAVPIASLLKDSFTSVASDYAKGAAADAVPFRK
jgi:hypothetical protein